MTIELTLRELQILRDAIRHFQPAREDENDVVRLYATIQNKIAEISLKK